MLSQSKRSWMIQASFPRSWCGSMTPAQSRVRRMRTRSGRQSHVRRPEKFLLIANNGSRALIKLVGDDGEPGTVAKFMDALFENFSQVGAYGLSCSTQLPSHQYLMRTRLRSTAVQMMIGARPLLSFTMLMRWIGCLGLTVLPLAASGRRSSIARLR